MNEHEKLLNKVEAAGFNLSAIAKALASRNGSIASEVKRAAAKENGKKGGRPKIGPVRQKTI